MQKRIRKFVLISCGFFILSAEALAAQQVSSSQANTPTSSSKDAANFITQQGTSYLNNVFNSTNRPGWLTRTDLTYAIQHNSTPVGGIETIQPIYETPWSTVFWQGRASYNDGSTTLNFGLGYRYLTDNKKLMWGVNTFYDENPRFLHRRLGLGGEIFTPYVTVRANYYDAYSGNQRVGVNTYEHALKGVDGSIETPVPWISWMRFTAQGYHWQGIHTTNVNGGLAKLRIFPARQVEIDTGVSDDNSQHTSVFFNLNYYFGSPAFIQYSGTTEHPSELFTPQNLENQRLQKVIRNNDIVVEKSTGSPATSAIIVSRGS